MSTRNPPWIRDELLLILDVYMRYNPAKISKKHSEVLSLSKILKKLPFHKNIPDRKHFRNPSSVYMQLRTFMSCDPYSKIKGLSHTNKLEKTIWQEFSGDLESLNRITTAIRALANSTVIKSLGNPVDEENACPSGKLLFRFHKKLENNYRLNERKKKQSTARKCESCGFSFEDTYGPVGKGYIEIHHKIPFYELGATRTARLADLTLVCSNCHRMLHRVRPGTSVRPA